MRKFIAKIGTFISIVLVICMITQKTLFADELAESLKDHVEMLSLTIGERNYLEYDNLQKAAEYIASEFNKFGYMPTQQVFRIKGKKYTNIIARKLSSLSEETLVIGAHYDSGVGTPGADDNASGVAALLEIARYFQDKQVNVNMEFVAFTNEEPPFFRSEDMGSKRYANEKKDNSTKLFGMICLEMLGYYSEKKGSQQYPIGLLKLFYPSTGNYIAFVSNSNSSGLKNLMVKGFKKNSKFKVRTLTAPSFVTGVGFSDHQSFWANGYKAIMVTDTAFYRNKNYHTSSDTIDTLDFEKMSTVCEGVVKAVEEMCCHSERK
ncbi:MAG: M28 family peptidase [Elusimicrobia bacterium]|nr:M28 family peptidase [Elusimicrobiota bacterium]